MDNSKMLAYFLEQPQQLKLLFQESEKRTETFIRYWVDNKPDRLYLIGSGTSYHALCTANRWMETFLGVEVSVASPTSLPVIRGRRPAVMLVSQSGASTNTLVAAEKLRDHHLLALTGETESPLHPLTEMQLDLGIGRETAGPKTIGYTATVLFLLMAALISGKHSNTVDAEMYQFIHSKIGGAVDAVEGNIFRTQAWFERNVAQLQHAGKYVVVGKETAAAVAGEGALKILETVKVPAAGYEFEEFLHGPILQIDKELAGIYYLCAGEDRVRMEALAALHATESPHVYRTYGAESKDPADPRDLPLIMSGEDFTQGIELIYPCQLIGASIPQIKTMSTTRNFLREYAAMHKIKTYQNEE